MKQLSTNLRLYPAYLVLIRLDFWLPVFFLYFSSLFSLQHVLILEAIYYAAVVTLEVPSGYYSDRIGRKGALITAATAGGISGLIFATGSTFFSFCIAQFFYAVFMAFNSGSDTALLYDTLKAEHRENELLDIESNAHAKAWVYGALASIVAGAAAYFGGYRTVYWLSAFAYTSAAIVALRFKEPPKIGRAAEATMVRQLGACRNALRDRTLLWLFLFYVGRTVFEHIPYEFFQPYLALVVPAASLPLISGLHLAITKLVSAGFAKKSAGFARRWGTVGTLLFSNVTITAIILAMALWVHPIIVILLLARNITHGLGQIVLNAAIHPRVESGLRATYLSLQSLVGRLSFSIALLSLSWVSGSGTPSNFETLSRLLLISGIASTIWVLGLVAIRPSKIDNSSIGR